MVPCGNAVPRRAMPWHTRHRRKETRRDHECNAEYLSKFRIGTPCAALSAVSHLQYPHQRWIRVDVIFQRNPPPLTEDCLLYDRCGLNHWPKWQAARFTSPPWLV